LVSYTVFSPQELIKTNISKTAFSLKILFIGFRVKKNMK